MIVFLMIYCDDTFNGCVVIHGYINNPKNFRMFASFSTEYI